jgi:hypothetical protein
MWAISFDEVSPDSLFSRLVCLDAMNSTFSILLLVGSVISIAATFILSVRPAGTTNVPISQDAQSVVPSPPPLPTNPIIDSLQNGIKREINLYTELQNEISYDITEYTVKPTDCGIG